MKIENKYIQSWFQELQDKICKNLETFDGGGVFREDLWGRPDGGGGRTRIIEGVHIEKGGVNFSAVEGKMPDKISNALGLPPNNFLATGVSIVLHPINPWVPIIHMNVRYFETDSGHWWFGGGIDVTPHIVIPGDAKLFHEKLNAVCNTFHSKAYQEYKDWADRYFFIPHRNETRGIGGIFFDKLNQSSGKTKSECWDFVQKVGESFLPCYEDFFLANYKKVFSEKHKNWQLVRRGRYVEFNLVYDKGTKFGLETKGRIESILMSLPPLAKWKYDNKPQSFELDTQKYLVQGFDWLNYRSV